MATGDDQPLMAPGDDQPSSMRAATVAGGLWRQLRVLFTVRRYQIMLALLPLSAWLSMDVYSRLVVRDLPVAVIDRDNSRLSRTIRHFLSATRELSVVETELSSVDEARRRVERGELAAVILLPSRLSERVKRGRGAQVPVAIDMSNLLSGKVVHKTVAQVLGTVAAGAQLTLVKKLGARKEQALGRVLPVRIDTSHNFNPATNYAVYMAPGLVFFLLHIFTLVLALSLVLPGSAPASFRDGVGAGLAVAAVACGFGLFFFYGMLGRVHIAPQGSLAAVLALLCVFAVADLALVLGLSRLLGKPMLTMEATLLYGMMSLMLAGVTWPRDMFPGALATAAELNPFTPFIQGCQTLLHYPTRLHELSPFFRQMGLQIALFAALGLVAGLLRRIPRRRREVSRA